LCSSRETLSMMSLPAASIPLGRLVQVELLGKA
jgi:hypothetical protein